MIPDVHTTGDRKDAIYLLRYMQEHYTTVSLPELSSFFGYSERQVQRLVKELTGKTFSQNIQDMKLTRAADLLRFSEQPVTQIILDLGYTDARSFRTLFKRKFGMTPFEYRKKGKKERPEGIRQKDTL